MEEKHFIVIIAIIVIIGFAFYAFGNINMPGSTNDNTESQDTIWVSSKNVGISSGDSGTHLEGKNDQSCWAALRLGGEQLFINSEDNFTVEMDAKIDNMMAIYFFTTLKSNGNISVIPSNSSDFQHLEFNYSASDHKLNYSVNGKLIKTIDCDFEGKPVGFKMVDWQGDMNVDVRNIIAVSN